MPLWVFCTRHTSKTRDGDLFVLSLCTVLKSSFSLLLYLMPLRESECDQKGLFFFITFFCIVSLKLINIPIEFVNFCQIFRYLDVTDEGLKPLLIVLISCQQWNLDGISVFLSSDTTRYQSVCFLQLTLLYCGSLVRAAWPELTFYQSPHFCCFQINRRPE